MMFEFALPIFPSFLQIDISDLPALVGAVTMGPTAGVLIELVKNVLHLFKTSTAGVGEVANFLVGIALVLPTGIIYKKQRNIAGFIMGVGLGCVLMVLTACAFNLYVAYTGLCSRFRHAGSGFCGYSERDKQFGCGLKNACIFCGRAV